MKHTLENKALTLYFEGELNSFTCKEAEKEIDAIMSGQAIEKAILDMERLTYISSAGLRIIVCIKQRVPDTVIVHVPKGVNDIFKMVGFGNVVKIES